MPELDALRLALVDARPLSEIAQEMMHGWSVSSAPRQEDAEDGFSTIEFQVRPRRDAHVIVGRAEGEDQLGYVDVSGADAVEAAADLAGLAHVVPRTLVHLIIRDERRSAGERLRWLRLMTRLYMDPLDAMFWDDDASTTVEMILNREDDVELRLEAATSVLAGKPSLGQRMLSERASDPKQADISDVLAAMSAAAAEQLIHESFATPLRFEPVRAASPVLVVPTLTSKPMTGSTDLEAHIRFLHDPIHDIGCLSATGFDRGIAVVSLAEEARMMPIELTKAVAQLSCDPDQRLRALRALELAQSLLDND